MTTLDFTYCLNLSKSGAIEVYTVGCGITLHSDPLVAAEELRGATVPPLACWANGDPFSGPRLGGKDE